MKYCVFSCLFMVYVGAILPTGVPRFQVMAQKVYQANNEVIKESDCKVSTSSGCDVPHNGGHVPSVLDVRGGGVLETISTPMLSIVENGKLSLLSIKALLQLGLTLLNIVCWAIPMRNQNIFKNDQALGIANTFAGGIFLMLAFSHMIPHSISVLQANGLDSSYAFKFTMLGYLLIFTIEKIIFDSHAIMHKAMGSGHNDTLIQSHKKDHHGAEKHTHPTSPTTSHAVADTDGEAISGKSAVVLLIAMGLHSLFETMALGMASDLPSALLMAASIALHQPAESIALLVALVKSSMKQRDVIRWLGLFSLVGPIGVLLGGYINEIASPLVEGALVAVTAGTFLYVGATEIVAEEFESVQGAEKMRKFLALCVGILVIGVISEFTSEDCATGHLGDGVNIAHSHQEL